MDQFIALVFCQQYFRRLKHINTVSNCIANKEIDYGRNGKIYQNLYQGIHLVFFPDSSHLKKCESSVHGKYHHRAKHQKQDIPTASKRTQFVFHCFSPPQDL